MTWRPSRAELERLTETKRDEFLKAARRWGANRDDAEDAVAAVFLKLWQQAPDTTPEETEPPDDDRHGNDALAFMMLCLRNAVRTGQRHQKRQRDMAERVARASGGRPAPPAVDEAAERERREAASRLERAVARHRDAISDEAIRIVEGWLLTEGRDVESVAVLAQAVPHEPTRQALTFLASGRVDGVPRFQDRAIGEVLRDLPRPPDPIGPARQRPPNWSQRAFRRRHEALDRLRDDLQGDRGRAPDEPRLTAAAWAWEIIAGLDDLEERTALQLHFFGKLCIPIWEDPTRRDALLDPVRLRPATKLDAQQFKALRWQAIGAFALDDPARPLIELGRRAEAIFLNAVVAPLQFAIYASGEDLEALTIYLDG